MSANIRIFESESELADAAAALFIECAAASIAARGVFTMALSGGSTPKAMYESLARPANASRVEWSKVQLFWGDERCVPPDSVDSNYRMARETLLDNIDIPAANVHRMEGELEPAVAAQRYEDALRKVFGDVIPRFDLLLLGLGENGHIASLFPHQPVLDEQTHTVAGVWVEEVKMSRITFTLPVINAAALVLFVVAGARKAAVVHRVLESERDPVAIPAQAVSPLHGRVEWMLDAAAASKLEARPE
jgi:6-phosphogluconolactonase